MPIVGERKRPAPWRKHKVDTTVSHLQTGTKEGTQGFTVRREVKRGRGGKGSGCHHSAQGEPGKRFSSEILDV